MLDVYEEPTEAAAPDALHEAAALIAADRTPLRKLAANIVDTAMVEVGGKKEGEKMKKKRKHRVSFGGEKVRHYQKSPRDAKPRASMSFFPRKKPVRSSLANVPSKPTFDLDRDFFDDDTDNEKTMDFTDMSILDLDVVNTLSNMNTFAGAPFDEEDLASQGTADEQAQITMKNFNIDPDVTQGLKSLVGDFNDNLFDTEPSVSAQEHVHIVEEAADDSQEPEHEDDSAMEMTICAPAQIYDAEEIELAHDTSSPEEEGLAEANNDEEQKDEEIHDDDDDMDAMDEDFQFDDEFGDEDATEHMFAVTHGRASLGPAEFANQAAAAELAMEEQSKMVASEAAVEHSYRPSMNMTVGDLETSTLTYNNTGFSDGSSMSSASITDLYSTSNPRIGDHAKQPRESLAPDEKTEHIFGTRNPRMRPSLARRRSSMGFGDDEDTNNVFGSGVNTQVLFDQVEGIRSQADAVQAEFEEGDEEEDNSIFMKTGPGTATSELARLMAESKETTTDKENLQPLLEDDDTQVDDFDGENKTEKFLLSEFRPANGGDTGTFSTFSLLNSATRHSTRSLSELASKLQLTPLDVRPHTAASSRTNNSMSLEYFLCQAKIHFVGISTIRKNSTCPVSIPYEDLLVDELPEGAERSIVPHIHTKLVVEPQLETYRAHNSGYEEQILAKQQSIEQLAAELSRNNPRSFVLAMQPESRDIVVNCLKELKQKCRMDAKAQWYSQHIHGLTQKRDRLKRTLDLINDEVKAWEEAIEDALSSDMRSSCPATPELKAKFTSASAEKVKELQDTVQELEDNFDTLQGLQGWRLSKVTKSSIQLLIADSYHLRIAEGAEKVEASIHTVDGLIESPLRKALMAALDIDTYLEGLTDMKQVPAAAQAISLWLGRMEEVMEECEESEQLHPNLSLSYGSEGSSMLLKARFVPASGPAGAALHSFTATFEVNPSTYPFSSSLKIRIDNEEGGSSLTMARNGIASAALRELSAKFAPPRCSFGRIRHTFAALVEALYGN